MEYENEFLKIIRDNKDLIKILKIVRDLELPNWYIGAGIIRDVVWNHFSGSKKRYRFNDIDLFFYSRKRISIKKIKEKLTNIQPNIKWDIENSAYLHEWYWKKRHLKIAPLKSVEEDVDSWPEYATAVALRLFPNDEIKIYAPYGLKDLMKMIFRRNKFGRRDETKEIFNYRVAEKKIAEKWPQAKIIYD